MKRILAVILVLVCAMCVWSCDKETDTEYEKVELTSENFEDYITLNAYITDFTISESGSNDKKMYSCVVHIETYGIRDYVFEDVKINYKRPSDLQWNKSTIPAIGGLDANLGSNGNSHVSFITWSGSITALDTSSFLKNIEFGRVSGYVYVPVTK